MPSAIEEIKDILRHDVLCEKCGNSMEARTVDGKLRHIKYVCNQCNLTYTVDRGLNKELTKRRNPEQETTQDRLIKFDRFPSVIAIEKRYSDRSKCSFCHKSLADGGMATVSPLTNLAYHEECYRFVKELIADIDKFEEKIEERIRKYLNDTRR